MTAPALLRAPSLRGPVRIPGLPVLPPNVERHPVPGGGTRTLAIDAGDELTVMVTEIDRMGRVNLSRRAVLEGSAYEAPRRDAPPRDGERRNGGRDRDGGRGRDAGRDRGPRRDHDRPRR